MFTFRRCAAAMVLAGAAGVQVGCGGCNHKPAAFDVAVSDGRASENAPPLEVDVAFVDTVTANRLEATPVRDYFGGNHPLRSELEQSGRKATALLGGANRSAQVERGDGRWKQWLGDGGASEVVVLAFIPGAADDAGRRRLTLDPCAWEERRLDVRITPAGVECVTPAVERKD